MAATSAWTRGIVAVSTAALLVPFATVRAERAPAQDDADHIVGTAAVKAFIASRIGKGFVMPRTPWGDPVIQGNFTIKDEANTPFERPDEWRVRKFDDITGKEF